MGLPDQWDTCSRTMMFEGVPKRLAHWGDIIAIGLVHDVVLLDAITGIRTSVLGGHTGRIDSLAFSQDGTLLMSGSEDKTVRVWDVQTGGVIRTFDHHPSEVVGTFDHHPRRFVGAFVRHLSAYFAASISSDGAMVALGTDDGIVRLCDVRTGGCNSIKMYDAKVKAIEFSPINPRHFISSSEGGNVRQWDIDGDQVGRSYHEADKVEDLAWTRDATRFVSCGGQVATVRDAESGAVVVKLDAPNKSSSFNLCCLSPDGRFVACATDTAIWVWDITISGARLVGHLVGHSNSILFLAFPSSLISGGRDQSMKFWKSSGFSMDPTTPDQITARGPFPAIRSIKLFAEEEMVVTSDEDGVVKTWEAMTGRCKSSFSTPAKGKCATHLARNTLIVVWCPDPDADSDGDEYMEIRGDDEEYMEIRGDSDRDSDRDTAMEYHIWDVYNGQLLRKFHSSQSHIRDLAISEDGSKIFGLGYDCIAAVSMQTGEEVGRVELESGGVYNLFVRGSKVWIDDPRRGRWDFGVLGVSPCEEFPDGPQLKLVNSERIGTIEPCWMEDIIRKRQVFRSLERYLDRDRQLKWDGRYLFNFFRSGEIIMIIDFDPVLFPRSASFDNTL